jgi:hypothetical protein
MLKLLFIGLYVGLVAVPSIQAATMMLEQKFVQADCTGAITSSIVGGGIDGQCYNGINLSSYRLECDLKAFVTYGNRHCQGAVEAGTKTITKLGVCLEGGYKYTCTSAKAYIANLYNIPPDFTSNPCKGTPDIVEAGAQDVCNYQMQSDGSFTSQKFAISGATYYRRNYATKDCSGKETSIIPFVQSCSAPPVELPAYANMSMTVTDSAITTSAINILFAGILALASYHVW